MNRWSLTFIWRWIVSEQNSSSLRSGAVGERLGGCRGHTVALLPVLHDVGEGELGVVLNHLQHEVLCVEVDQGI